MRTHAIAMLAAAACGASPPATDGPPPDVPTDAPPDVPDRLPINLIQLCGAQPVTLDDWERCYQKRKCEWEVGCVPANTYRDVKECVDLADAVALGRLAAERRERQRSVEAGRASVNV